MDSRISGGPSVYVRRQADSFWRYILEQGVQSLVGWIPTVIGIGLRAICYRAILRMGGMAAIESGVRLRFASHIQLGDHAYLDQGVYLHACPNGTHIGSRSLAMLGWVLPVTTL